jgi:hypothetical protein
MRALITWLVRLAFLGSVALGFAALYEFCIVAPRLTDVLAAWQAGILLSVAGLGSGSIATLARRIVDGSAASGGRSMWWYTATWVLFPLLALAAVLSGVALRLSDDRHRSPVTVTATVAQCDRYSDANGNWAYDCTYTWTWKGVEHEQDFASEEQYVRTEQVDVHVDPATGGADDHALTPIVTLYCCSGFVLLVLLVALLIFVLDYRDRPESTARVSRRGATAK